MKIKWIAFKGSIFSSNITTFTVPSHSAAMLPVFFNPDYGKEYTDTLTIKSTDPFNEYEYVYLSGKGLGPIYSASKSILDFGKVGIGKDSTLSLDVRNFGNRDLVISIQDSFTSRFSTDFSSAVVPADSDSVRIAITFRPTMGKSYSDNLKLSVNNPIHPERFFYVSGTGGGPEAEISPGSIDFGIVLPGEQKTESLTIKNTGTDSLVISSIVKSDTCFVLSDSTGKIPPGDSKIIQVTFSPADKIEYSDTLWIYSNANLNSLSFITLNGLGGYKEIFLPDTTLSFDSTKVTTSVSDSFVIKNIGISPLVISGITKNQAVFYTGLLPDTVMPSDSVYVKLFFSPASRQSYSDTLTITSNDPENSTKRMYITGLGTASLFSTTTTSMNFDSVLAGDSSSVSFYIKNTGNSELIVSKSGTIGSVFSTSFSSGSVSVGDSLQVAVLFKPDSARGDYSGNLILNSNDPENPADTISVSGVGKASKIELSVTSMVFDTVTVGDTLSKSLVIRNLGTDTLLISEISTQSAFFSVDDTLAVINAGDSLVTQIKFSPHHNIGYLDTVFIHSNALNDTFLTVNLKGNNGRNFVPIITSVPDTNLTEDQLYRYIINYYDYDGHGVIYRLITGPDSMKIDTTGAKIEFLPLQSDVGSSTVSLYIDDNNGGLDTQTFVIHVAQVNEPPVITSTANSIWFLDTLNTYQVTATDEENDPLSYGLEIFPDSMTMDSSGLVQWTPHTSAKYYVKLWAKDTANAKVYQELSIEAKLSNKTPVITSQPDTNAYFGFNFSYDVEATDQNGDTLVYRLLQRPDGMSIDSTTGLIIWNFTAVDTGIYLIILQVEDGMGEKAQQLFNLHVMLNSPPNITSIPDTISYYGKLYTYTVTAQDLNNDPIVYGFQQKPDSMVIDSTSGVVTWTPMESDTGVFTIIVEARDSEGGIGTQTYCLYTLQWPNQVPQITSVPDTVSYTDRLYTYTVTATDTDNDTLTFRLLQKPAGMSIDSSSGSINWTPALSDTGDYNIIIEADDGAGASAQQTYTLHILRLPNYKPEITALADTVAMEGLPFYRQVYAADIDPEDTITFTDNSPLFDILSSGLISFIPQQGSAGTYDIKIFISDGTEADTAGFKLTIKDTNARPAITAVPDTFAYEDSLYYYKVSAADTDTMDNLVFSDNTALFDISPDSGIISFTPVNNNVGQHNITIYVNDGLLMDSTSFLLTVVNTNDAPVITSVPDTVVNEGENYIYQATAADVDGDSVFFGLNNSPQGMNVSNSGLLSWQPGAADIGTHQVELYASDIYGAKGIQSFYLTVRDSNQAPVFTVQFPDSIYEDQNFSIHVTADDPDSDSVYISGKEMPPGSSYDSLTQIFTWIPSNSQTGNNTIIFEAQDSLGGTGSLIVNLYVIPVNDAPYFTSIPEFTIMPDSVHKLILSDYTIDPDNDKSALTWSVSGGSRVLFTLDNNIVSFYSSSVFDSTEEFTAIVSDPGGLADTVKIVIHVSTSGYQPGLENMPDKLTVNEDESKEIELTPWVTDKDSDLNRMKWKIPSSELITVEIDSVNKKALFIPEKDYYGYDTLSVKVTDPEGHSTEKLLPVEILPVNDSPEITFFCPALDTTITDGDLLTFKYSAEDPENDSFSQQWLYNGDPVSKDTAYTLQGSKTGGREKYVELLVFDSNDTTSLLWNIHIKDKIIGGIIEETGVVPDKWELKQNYPNPFNPGTVITLHQKRAADTKVFIYSVKGQIVRQLINRRLSPGIYRISWDGRNDSGLPVTSGVYIYQVRNKFYTFSKTMILLK